MQLFTLGAVNVLLNGIFVFTFAWALSSGFARLFRIKNLWLQFAFALLPFAKLLHSLVVGLPSTSFLRTGLNVRDLPMHAQMLTLSASSGSTGGGLNFGFQVYKFPEKTSIFGLTPPDYLTLWMQEHWGLSAIVVLLIALAVPATIRITKDIVSWVRFERERKHLRKTQGESFQTLRCDWRKVDVYLSKAHVGTPFTGGLFSPYICLPKFEFEKLSDIEKKAVVLHELGHVKHIDVLTNFVIRFLKDVFWFVPLYSRATKRVSELREMLADAWAVKAGATHAALASALLRFEEWNFECEGCVFQPRFHTQSFTTKRVELLLNEGAAPGGPHFKTKVSVGKVLRALLITLSVSVILNSTFCTNRVEPTRTAAPEWVESFAKWLETHLNGVNVEAVGPIR